jgi:hypothetical protein
VCDFCRPHAAAGYLVFSLPLRPALVTELSS